MLPHFFSVFGKENIVFFQGHLFSIWWGMFVLTLYQKLFAYLNTENPFQVDQVSWETDKIFSFQKEWEDVWGLIAPREK